MHRPLFSTLVRVLVCGLVLGLGSSSRATAQKRYWHRWQYQTAGVDFTAGRQPVPYVPTYPAGGPAQIADSTGAVSELFLESGATLFSLIDRNGTRLPNAFYLPSGALRDGLLVPWPHHPEYTLCFYVREAASLLDLRYALVDRRLRAGLGDVSLRGFPYWQVDSVSPPLHPQAREGMALVPHANGRDYWVITTTTTGLNTYLVSPQGVSRSPRQSALLTPQVPAPSADYPTVVRPTTRGNGFVVERIVADAAGDPLNRVEYYPFDNRTGQVAVGRLLLANVNVVSNGRFVRGFTPSPNGRRVYAMGGDSTRQELVQFDLTAPDSASFRASRQRVYAEAVGPGATGTWTPLTPMRAGPNGKFYLLFNNDTLSVINCPDAPAAQCGFQRNGLVVPGAGGNILSPSDHLPATFYFLPGFTLQNAPLGSLCQGQPLTVSLNNALYLDSARWQFGDGAAGAGTAPLPHLYAQPGTYRVRVRVWYNGCSTDTLSQLVMVRPLPPVRLPADTVVCGARPTVLVPQGVSGGSLTYRWNTGATTPTLAVTTPGTYALTVTTEGGCSATVLVRVATGDPTLRLPADSVLCAQGGVRLLRPLAMSPAVVSYRWQDGSTSPTYRATQPGTYTLTVTTAAGCTATARTVLAPARAPVNLLGPDTTACLGQEVRLRVHASPASGPVAAVRWADGSTGATFPVTAPGTYGATVTLASGCRYDAAVRVDFVECPDRFTLPNVITPNNDQRNDAFVVPGLAPDVWQLDVYSRWGQPVYHQSGYRNGEWGGKGWPRACTITG